jgi:hypothetical protein
MQETRKYQDASEVAVGDVVQSFEGAFGSSIITRIEAVEGHEPLVHLARPMARMDVSGGVWTHTENYSAYLSSIVANFQVYVTGPSMWKDTRAEG